MKKTLLSIVAVLFGIALNAQVSVWDGTAEEWVHGSGTPEDPYLIENAQNLAYLAQKVNEPNTHNPLGHDIFDDTHFLLTTDLDLGGTGGLLWTPVGKSDRINEVITWFCGSFDGDGHNVKNMRVEYSGKSNLSFGLFGNARHGSIKNIIMGADCFVDVNYENINGETGLYIGSILGCGNDVCLDGCVNKGSVHVDGGGSYWGARCGGLFGVVSSGTITNCHNIGNVYCREWDDFGNHAPAGIVGGAGDCTVFGCSNTGDITCIKYYYGIHQGGVASGGIIGSAGGNTTVEQCCNTGNLLTDEVEAHNVPICSGGIVGCSNTGSSTLTLHIKNCYSVAEISAITVMPEDKGNYAGGIFGGTYNTGWGVNYTTNITIENCYAVGNITADTIGGILAKYGFMPESVLSGKEAVVLNSYYDNSINSANDYGTAVSEEYLKSSEFVDALNTDGIVFMVDDNDENNGFPVFVNRFPYDIEENADTNEISVYPNPAKDYAKIMISDESYCRCVEIYSIDGRMMRLQTSGFETIDLTNLNSGIYIMKVRMADGKEIAERIVVE